MKERKKRRKKERKKERNKERKKQRKKETKKERKRSPTQKVVPEFYGFHEMSFFKREIFPPERRDSISLKSAIKLLFSNHLANFVSFFFFLSWHQSNFNFTLHWCNDVRNVQE